MRVGQALVRPQSEVVLVSIFLAIGFAYKSFIILR